MEHERRQIWIAGLIASAGLVGTIFLDTALLRALSALVLAVGAMLVGGHFRMRDHLRAEQAIARLPDLEPEILSQIDQHLRDGEKLKAVKVIYDAGHELVDAKHLVEARQMTGSGRS